MCSESECPNSQCYGYVFYQDPDNGKAKQKQTKKSVFLHNVDN